PPGVRRRPHPRIGRESAAGGPPPADRPRVIRAMDGILSPAAERQRARPHGIARTSAWDHVRQRRLVALDLGGWRPGRAQLLAADIGRARPLLADPADADRIAHGLAVAEHVIEPRWFSPRRCRSNT